jgi:hypothetical protein
LLLFVIVVTVDVVFVVFVAADEPKQDLQIFGRCRQGHFEPPDAYYFMPTSTATTPT